MTISQAAILTEQLIDAAIAYEKASGADNKPARAALYRARAAIESALTQTAQVPA